MPNVQLPDNSIVSFPDGTDPVVINEAITQFLGKNAAQTEGAVSAPIPDNQPKTGMPTAFPGFQKGLSDTYTGGAQLFLHGLEAAFPEYSDIGQTAKSLRLKLDKHIADSEAEYLKNNPEKASGADVGRFVGNVVGAAPLAAAVGPESLAGRIAVGAGTGALMGAAQPSMQQGSDYWLEKAKEGAAGAIGGAGGAVAGAAIGRAVSPKSSPDIEALTKSGVNLTPGQLGGKATSRLEEGLTSMPLAGDVIKAGQMGAIKDFNRATINQALAPIGEKLGQDTEIGRKAIDEMATKIGTAYDKLVPNLTAKVDQQFATNVQNLAGLAANLPGDQAKQFTKVLQNEVLGKFSPNGTMTGETFKEVESTLGQMASDYSHSGNVSERYFGNAVRQLQDEMRQMLARSNPAAAQQLQQLNMSYAMLKRIQAASNISVKNDGVFTPAQLLQAIRSQDPSLGKGSFARGNALMQVYGQAGENILGSKLPDSGTAFRNMVDHPLYAAVMSPAALAAIVPYSSLGRKLATIAVARRPAIAATLAQGIRGAAPIIGGGILAHQQPP